MERLLETEAAKRLDLQTTFLVRTAKEWRAVITKNPFREEAKSDPSHLVVAFLKDAPQASAVRSLQAAIRGSENVRAQGRQLYIVYPAGIGRSKSTNKLIEDTLDTRATGRNWNTVLKLAARGALGDLAGGGAPPIATVRPSMLAAEAFTRLCRIFSIGALFVKSLSVRAALPARCPHRVRRGQGPGP